VLPVVDSVGSDFLLVGVVFPCRVQDTIRSLKDQIEAEEKKLSALRSRAKLG
jgi:hypothetical protein